VAVRLPQAAASGLEEEDEEEEEEEEEEAEEGERARSSWDWASVSWRNELSRESRPRW
jgi:hypothetical protein